ncbi:hypothetical protein BH11MYX1_BH11MYX1_26470 [soil metagenome]
MADRPKTPTQRGHDSDVTSYDTPSSLRRAKPAPDGRDAFVDDADDATDIYDAAKLKNQAQAPAFTVKSMKMSGELSSGQLPLPANAQPSRPMPQVKLRAMSEVAAQPVTPQQSLGYLAPPRNPADARARKARDFIVWGSVCVILACFVALGIWFIAK